MIITLEQYEHLAFNQIPVYILLIKTQPILETQHHCVMTGKSRLQVQDNKVRLPVHTSVNCGTQTTNPNLVFHINGLSNVIICLVFSLF